MGEGERRNDGQKQQQHEARNPSSALPPALLHSAYVQWQLPGFCMAPSHNLPYHRALPIPGFPPVVMLSFPLVGVKNSVVCPTPSRGSCRNKRNLSGSGRFNMALLFFVPCVYCVRNLGPSPTTPPHPDVSFCHSFRWKEP